MVEPPPGLAVPLRVAVLLVSAVAALVVTVGARADVVNDTTEPKDVPYALRASAQV